MIEGSFPYDTSHPWYLQRDTSRYLSAWLTSHGIPFRPTKTNHRLGNYCLEVQRFQLWTYWRPLTVQKFTQMTQYFEGPHCPILASRLKYLDDEQIVYEGFDFNMRRTHRYQARSFYFVIPEFLLYRPWPAPRNWRWQPAVKVTQSVVRDLLWLELEYGGWPRNRRGTKLIPFRTGQSGMNEGIEMGGGWATYSGRPSAEPKVIRQQGDLFNAY